MIQDTDRGITLLLLPDEYVQNHVPDYRYRGDSARINPIALSNAPAYIPPTRRSCIVRTSTLDPAFVHANLDIVHDSVRLLLEQDLGEMTRGWNAGEFEAERRLVQVGFTRISPSEYFVKFTRILREDFDISSPIISCIYWKENDTHIVTSVDVILILESFVQENFTIEEKNRIRRNLQSLKPFTITRANSSFKRFFNLLMSMENPRPRNIEQDLKVFKWDLLFQALAKVVSKYSILDCSPENEAVAAQVSNIAVVPLRQSVPSLESRLVIDIPDTRSARSPHKVDYRFRPRVFNNRPPIATNWQGVHAAEHHHHHQPRHNYCNDHNENSGTYNEPMSTNERFRLHRFVNILSSPAVTSGNQGLDNLPRNNKSAVPASCEYVRSESEQHMYLPKSVAKAGLPKLPDAHAAECSSAIGARQRFEAETFNSGQSARLKATRNGKDESAVESNGGKQLVGNISRPNHQKFFLNYAAHARSANETRGNHRNSSLVASAGLSSLLQNPPATAATTTRTTTTKLPSIVENLNDPFLRSYESPTLPPLMSSSLISRLKTFGGPEPCEIGAFRKVRNVNGDYL